MSSRIVSSLLPVSLCCCSLLAGAGGYRPVVILHGLLDSPHGMDHLSNYIQEKHPGTNVTILDVLHGWRSLAPLWTQVGDFAKHLRLIMNQSADGINLISYSQGGLVARGIVESTKEHNVNNFISLSAPMMGQYGNYKDNFKRLNKLVLVGGPDDGIVTPWQSSQFGFYNDKEEVVLMRNQTVYTEDRFGLRSLDQSRRLLLFTMKGIDHFSWHKNTTVFDRAVLPFLD